ncbi:hypothetical protein [Pseudomonas sp. TWI929]|uniref:hypothetical protein n=1 Tax=Pseudomonas sp. TWI929 TaxID=3136795 RepID=UPI00320AA374
MPTENRSSNTEMVSVPRELAERIQLRLDHAASAFKAAKPERDHFRALLAKPAPQPHAEPIAWMVGTAIWWTKEEAERDAAATGLPIVAIGPVADPGEVERLKAWGKANQDLAQTCMDEVETLRAKLAERDALLDRMYYYLSPALASHQYSMSEETIHDALSALHEWRQIKASAEPISPTWSCQPCQLEQPTDRPCDVCGQATERTSAKS